MRVDAVPARKEARTALLGLAAAIHDHRFAANSELLCGLLEEASESRESGKEFRPHSSLGERTPSEIEGSGDWMPRGPQKPGS
jgi:hypothetical protein